MIDKWCIKPANTDEGAVVCDWINQFTTPINFYGSSFSTHYYWHFPAYDKSGRNFCYTSPEKGYRIIDFAEFKKITLRKSENYDYLIKVLKKYNIR